MVARDNNTDSKMFGLEELIELIDELRLAGYDIGTQQYISAQSLLLTLAARGQLPANPRDLETWLAPLLCSSPKEQDHFYQHYQQWLERHPHLLEGVVEEEQKKAKSVPAQRSSRKTTRRRFIRPRFLAIASGVLLALIGGAVLYIQFVPRTLSGKLIDAQDNRPLSGAAIQFAGQTLRSDNQGQFAFTYRRKNATATVDISLEKYESTTVIFNGQRFRTRETLADIFLNKQDGYEPLLFPPVIPTPLLPAPVPTPAPESFFRRHFELIRALAVLLPLLVFAAWWLWREYRRRMLLQKLSSASDPLLKRIVVKGAAAQLFRGQTFRRLAQELRRHRRRVSRDVDAQLTVQATVEKGGLFVPFYVSRKTLPEYLALVDRASLGDQQARFEDELINRLVEDNVFVDRYYYNDDPRICRTDSKHGSFFSLQDLASRHPDHHLVIFGEGSGLINRLTGEPEQWLEIFSPWTGRALMTPESPAHWSYREWVLADLDFAVLPASTGGLAALIETINTGVPTKTNGVSSPPFPELLRENSVRWLERHEVQPLLTGRLRDQLQAYLGEEGFHWLCACAVYPKLSWDLTLYFGYKLLGNHEHFEEKLLSLVRLPWFRHGDIPNWLRTRLIAAMSASQESVVRRMLEDLLLSLIENPTEGISLEIAPRPKEAAPRGWRRIPRVLAARLRRWRQQGKLRRFLGSLPKESPLRDHVFLSFMSGRKPRKLDVSVPAMLRRILYPQAQPSLGLRTATAFTFALLASLAGLTGMNARRPKVEPSGPIAEASPSPTASPSAQLAKETGRPSDYSKFSHTNPQEHAALMSRSNCASCHRPGTGSLAVPLHKDCTGCHLVQFTVSDRSAEANPICTVCHTKDGLNSSNPPLKSLNGNAQIMPGAVASPQPRTPTPSPNGRNGNVREAPDNSYIVTVNGYLHTRYFRDAACPVQRVEFILTNFGLLYSGVAYFRDGKTFDSPYQVAPILMEAGKCVDIVKVFTAGVSTLTPTPASTPTGSPVVLFDSWGTAAVTNVGPPRQFTISFDKPYFITQIQNYHWNDGRGASPGRISLRRSDGTIFGPWKVTATSGSGGAPNVNWECTPNVRIPAGTYRVVDSSPYTWSGNSQASDRGMTRIRGVPVP